LIGRGSESFPYPFTIQNVMWLMFCFALGELWARFNRAAQETRQLGDSPLPWNDDAILFRRGSDLARIYNWTRANPATRNHMLQRLTGRVVQQFQTSGSVDQAGSVMASSLELMQHEVDLKYNLLRYLVWLIPTLGFIGTVVGIAFALAEAGQVPADLQNPEQVRAWLSGMTGELGVAFYTTLLALLMAAVVVFLMHIAQAREEGALNTVGQCCLDHLVNRLVGEDK
jgi:biopolymer transport protein ExbB/TolQ